MRTTSLAASWEGDTTTAAGAMIVFTCTAEALGTATMVRSLTAPWPADGSHARLPPWPQTRLLTPPPRHLHLPALALLSYDFAHELDDEHVRLAPHGDAGHPRHGPHPRSLRSRHGHMPIFRGGDAHLSGGRRGSQQTESPGRDPQALAAPRPVRRAASAPPPARHGKPVHVG